MPNNFFRFKQFTVQQDRCAMKVTTDACLFGAWVAHVLADKKVPFKNCLDIGTGTGLLSLMIAQKTNGNIEGIEIDENAAAQAAENVQASKWSKQIRIVQNDVLRWKSNTRYDCIVSNPPFYEKQLKSDASKKNLAHHDEGLTLSALLPFLKNWLTPDGSFFLLIPTIRLRETCLLLEKSGLFLQQKVLVKQTSTHEPFRVMLEARIVEKPQPNDWIMTIKNENGEYTREFADLLRDYYFYL